MIRRLVAWTMPRSLLVADVLIIGVERDEWRRRAEHAERAEAAALVLAHRCVDELLAEQARPEVDR